MKQINVGEDSWHYRKYESWMKRHQVTKPEGFHENLCHYARVVAYALVEWFFTEDAYRGLSPAIILATLVAAAGVLYAIVVYPIGALFIAGIVIFILLVLAVVLLLAYLASKLPNSVVNLLILLTIPVWGPIFLLLWTLNVLWEKVIEPIWFKSHSWILAVWFWTVVFIVLGVRLILGASAFTELVIMATFALVVGTVVCLIIFLGSRYFHWRKNRPAIPVEKPKGISTPNLLYRIAQSKVGSRICPFIKLPHQWTGTEESVPAD